MNEKTKPESSKAPASPPQPRKPENRKQPAPVEEIGGREGPDPTRYGDWEKNGRCIDF